jgi:uncharacterized membrane protein YeaQ/YmgE (transglycosylase-associated protein family)
VSILAWIVLGLCAGGLAQLLLPSDNKPRGCISTLVIGVLGALIGGFVANRLGLGELGTFFDIETWLIAIIGSFVLLALLALIGRLTSSGRRRTY